MGEQATGKATHDDLIHEQAVLLARRRAREQLDTLAAQCPAHKITVETYPGREDRYVAQAVTASARPYLLITTDLDELSTELYGPGEHPRPRSLPHRAPGTSWIPPHVV